MFVTSPPNSTLFRDTCPLNGYSLLSRAVLEYGALTLLLVSYVPVKWKLQQAPLYLNF